MPFHCTFIKNSKMRNCGILLLCVFISYQANAFDWSKIGHRTTGEIAENYLTKKTKRALDELLDGESLAVVSTYADEIKSDKAYRSYGPWHYVNVPFEKTYNTHPKSERGDLIQGIDRCIAIIKNPTSSKNEKVFHIKMLVHLIGDLHQPLHTGLQEDKGGNDFQVQWFKSGTNLHTVWDTKMIEHYNMSYSELAKTMPKLTKTEVQQIQAGDAIIWMEESRELVKKIYQTTSKGDALGYRYMYDYFDVLRGCLQNAGIRLAGLLNELLG